MMDKTLRRTCAAVAATGLLVSAAACSSDDADSGKSASDMVLTDSDTPAGYEWNDAADALEDGDDDDISELLATAEAVKTDPEQCASLAQSPVTVLAMLQDNPDTTAAVEFLPQDETDPAVINAVLSTDPENTGMTLPDDLAECASFTQSSDLDQEGGAVNYQAEVTDADVLGAENVHVVTVVNDSDSQSGENPASVVVGSVDGVAFRINASGVEEPNILLDLVDRQVDRIRGNDPDED